MELLGLVQQRSARPDQALLARGRALYTEAMGQVAARAAGRPFEWQLVIAGQILADAAAHALDDDVRASAHVGCMLVAVARHRERHVILDHLRAVARYGTPELVPALIVGLDTAAGAHLTGGDMLAARTAASLCEQIRSRVPPSWLPSDDEAHAEPRELALTA